MNTTNLEYLKARHSVDAEYLRRFKALENQIKQLQAYHFKARPNKRETIRRILYTYESLYERIIIKMEKEY